MLAPATMYKNPKSPSGDPKISGVTWLEKVSTNQNIALPTELVIPTIISVDSYMNEVVLFSQGKFLYTCSYLANSPLMWTGNTSLEIIHGTIL